MKRKNVKQKLSSVVAFAGVHGLADGDIAGADSISGGHHDFQGKVWHEIEKQDSNSIVLNHAENY